MTRIAMGLAVLLAARAASAGPIAQEFINGYEGIRWGTPLAGVVGMLPGGDHYFAALPSSRVYAIRNNEPLFGVPREGMRIQYCFSTDGGLEQVGIDVAFERRDQLVGALIAQFGPYARLVQQDVAMNYVWPRDHGVSIAVRASRDPVNGILELWIQHYPDPADGSVSRR